MITATLNHVNGGQIQAPCPAWCDGTHPIIGEGIYHCAEVGRIDSGQLALVVTVSHWIPHDDTETDNGPAVTLAWEQDGYVNLLEGIELELSDSRALIPLLQKANGILCADYSRVHEHR